VRLLLLALLTLFPLSSGAQERASRPHVILVLCDALTLDDLRSAAYPHLAHAVETGAIGLMNCAVAGTKTPTAATLTLAIGQHLPAEATDELAANDFEAVLGERGDVRAVYARRTGTPSVALTSSDPVLTVHHLGIASLARRDLAANRLGAALAQVTPPVRAFVIGNTDAANWQRRAALLTVDATGTGVGFVAPLSSHPTNPSGLTDDPIALMQAALEANAELCVLQLGDTARVEAERPQLSLDAYHDARYHAINRLDLLLYLLTAKLEEEGRSADILLVSPYPPADDARHPDSWHRLTPVLALGPDFPAGLLTSATTRTPGLIANVDIAPTLLALFHAPVPATMIGHPAQSLLTSQSGLLRSAAVARLDYVAALNAQALVGVVVPIGAVCFLMVMGSLVARKRGGRATSQWFAPGLVFTLTLPMAAMLAPLLVPPTLLEYGLRIAAWMLGLTMACYLLARLTRVSPPVMAALLGVLLVAGDTLAGQPLLKDSALSSYPLSGIRYYGVGNEYLGMLLGLALMGGFAWLDDRALPCPPGKNGGALRWGLGLGWLGLALLLGWPGLGANAGSLAATGAGFGTGAALLRGRRATLRLALAWILVGLLLALGFGALDAAFASASPALGGSRSHFGEALHAAAGGRGPGYLVEIVLRKVGMNLRLLMSPWLLAAAAMPVITILGARALVGEALREVLVRRPWTARGLSTVFAAGLASLVFKDSGVVTVTYLIGATCLLLLYPVVCGETQTPPGNSA
jgi:hypothetical protein